MRFFTWEISLDKGGTRRDKLLQISTYVLDKFVLRRKSRAIIHNFDRKWALEANEGIILANFKASLSLLCSFKNVYRIVFKKSPFFHRMFICLFFIISLFRWNKLIDTLSNRASSFSNEPSAQDDMSNIHSCSSRL